MPPNAVDARKRLTRNRRFRGHGPLLQLRGPIQRWVTHQRGDIQGVLPLLVHPAGTPPRAARPERRPWPAATVCVSTAVDRSVRRREKHRLK